MLKPASGPISVKGQPLTDSSLEPHEVILRANAVIDWAKRQIHRTRALMAELKEDREHQDWAAALTSRDIGCQIRVPRQVAGGRIPVGPVRA